MCPRSIPPKAAYVTPFLLNTKLDTLNAETLSLMVCLFNSMLAWTLNPLAKSAETMAVATMVGPQKGDSFLRFEVSC